MRTPANPLAPWHMWGGSKRVQVIPVAAGTARASLQIAKVSYKRPETWRFFVGAQLSGSGTTTDIVSVSIAVDLTCGVGRTAYRTENLALAGFPQFILFRWNLAPGFNLGAIPKRWTTVGSRVQLDDLDATDLVRPEWIVAEDIQCSARVSVTAETTEPPIEVEVSAYFAPSTHVRPDWFEGRYPGGELGGT